MSNSLDLYLSKRDAIQTGDPIQFQSNTLIGLPIQWRTGSPYNHTAIAIRFKEYDRERVYILEALEHGTVLNPLSARLEKQKGHAWVLPLKADLGPIRKGIGTWALTHVGRPYDYTSLFKQLICRVNADARNIFCSEYFQLGFTEAARGDTVAEQYLLEARKKANGKAWRPGDIPRLGLTQKEIQIL